MTEDDARQQFREAYEKESFAVKDREDGGLVMEFRSTRYTLSPQAIQKYVADQQVIALAATAPTACSIATHYMCEMLQRISRRCRVA